MKKWYILSGALALIVILLLAVHPFRQAKDSANPYGVPADRLRPETRGLLNDPNYRNIVLPDDMGRLLKQKGDLYVYFFASDCPHCRRSTPLVMPIARKMHIDLEEFNLLEFPDGMQAYGVRRWPTLVHYRDGQAVQTLTGEVTNRPDAGKGYVTTAQIMAFFGGS